MNTQNGNRVELIKKIEQLDMIEMKLLLVFSAGYEAGVLDLQNKHFEEKQTYDQIVLENI